MVTDKLITILAGMEVGLKSFVISRTTGLYGLKFAKSFALADDLANLSPYNPVVREIAKDFKPTSIPAKIVISLAVTITYYIKVRNLRYIIRV